MLRLLGANRQLCDGINRRDWMRIGGLSLGGLTLPNLLRQRVAQAANHAVRAKSVIVLFNSGGIPHHESWDPKPEAPEAIRGEFGAIPTRTPGLFVGELMPQTALLTEDIAVIRSMVTGDNAHSTSGYQMLTGIPHVPLNRENSRPGRPNDWPASAAIVQMLREPRGGLPAAIALPRRLANNNGQDPWPGTDGGFLGQPYDPWLLECDPNEQGFTVPGGELLAGNTTIRLDHRRTLLQQLDQHLGTLQDRVSVTSYDRYQQQAVDLIAGGKAREAFNLDLEPAAVRDRYGRTKHGQSALLARRLVEAGVSLVQVHSVSADKNRPNGGGWDTHEKHSASIKGWLMPDFDRLYSALISDLKDRGLLDETLVCWVSEFGHTPRFNSRGGRDHWGRVFSIALAGGGIRGGIVHGESDKNAAEPLSDIVHPQDYLATVFHCMGYEPETMMHDLQGRPIPISRGKVVEGILA